MYPLCPYQAAWKPGMPDGTRAGGAIPGPTDDAQVAIDARDPSLTAEAREPSLAGTETDVRTMASAAMRARDLITESNSRAAVALSRSHAIYATREHADAGGDPVAHATERGEALLLRAARGGRIRELPPQEKAVPRRDRAARVTHGHDD